MLPVSNVFRNLKISHKIVGSLLIILILTALVSGVGLHFLNEMNNRLNNIVDVSAEKVKLAGRINQHMSEIGRVEKSIILVETQQEVDAFADATEKDRSELEDRVAKLRDLVGEEGQRQLDQFDRAWLEYLISNQEVQDLARENSDRQAFLLAFGEERKLCDQIEAELDDLMQKLNGDLAAAERDEDFQTYQKAAEKAMLVARIKQTLLTISRAEKNLILANTQENVDKAYVDMDAGRVEMQDHFSQLRELVDPQEQATRDELVATYNEWQKIQHQVRKLALANTRQKAIDISQGEGREVFDQAASYIAAIVDRNDAELAADKQASNNNFVLVRSVMLGVTAFAIIAGLALGVFVSRAIARGIQAMVKAAEAIANIDLVGLVRVTQAVAGGDLTARVDIVTEAVVVQSKDELGNLATTFNQMIASLRETGQAFDQMTAKLRALEQQVTERTRNLEDAVDQSRRRALRLEASAQVARAVTSVLDPDALLSQVVDLIADRVGFYHVGVFLMDETSQYAVLRAANSEGGRRMLARGHRLRVGEQGIVGYVTSTGRPRIALDVGADAVYFDNPDLPLTRSEMALPLVARERILGALDVQSVEPEAFDDEDVAVLGTLADQIAVALDNARLFEEAQAALQEMRALQAQYTRRTWRAFTAQQETHTVEHTRAGVASVGDQPLPEADHATSAGETVVMSGDGDGQTPASLVVPLKLYGQTIGVLGFQETEPGRVWTEDEIALAETAAYEIAQILESARLFEDTQQHAWREQTAGQITAQIRASTDVESILQTAAEELGRALGVSRAIVRLGKE